MMLEEIQLDAYSLPNDHQVYKCFPGEGYKFYDVVHKSSVVFLDIRGLDELSENPAAWNDDDLRRVIASDQLVRSAAKRGRRGPRQRRSAVEQRNFNFAKGLLLKLQNGDLVVVPPPGYRRDVLIGQIIDDPGAPSRVEARDGDATFTYVGRKVRWLANVEKRLLKHDLLDKLHTAQAFFAVGESLHEDIYSIAYRNYVWRGTFVATFDTTKERFTSADNLVASVWFNGLAAARNAAEVGVVLAGDSFVDAALSSIGAESENELELNINSPGTILVRSASAFALATMAMLPLDVGDAQQVADGTARITLRAVGGSDPNCQLQVEAAVAEYVRSLGPEKLLEACEYAEKTRTSATLHTKVRLKRVTRATK